MRVFSGIRPSGQLHLGNYFGAIQSWLKLQDEHECFFCIADLHALTTPYSPKELKKYTLETAIDYLSLGINPKNSILFIQSTVPQHAELAWVLATVASVGDLKRMTQYKTKIKEIGGSFTNAALLEYPLLMAADILLYQTSIVPVGKDQTQHVELTRDLARRFNHRFGTVFTVPEVILSEQGLSIKSLQNPLKKMSKTGSPKDCIFLTDSPQTIQKKINVAVTDSDQTIKYDPKRKPGISNLLNIYALSKNISLIEAENIFRGKSYHAFKQAVGKEIIKTLSTFQNNRSKWKKDIPSVEKVLKNGQKKAYKVATITMTKVKERLGLYNN